MSDKKKWVSLLNEISKIIVWRKYLNKSLKMDIFYLLPDSILEKYRLK